MVDKELLPIVLFGAGPVAASTLEALNQVFTIEAVITKPRPAHHKGTVPTLELAEKLDLPLFTVETSQQLTQLTKEQAFASRVGVVVDFGVLISKESIDSFELGIINSHFSLLPQWRGPDPITAAILSGAKKTGVSLMLIVPELDEGPLIAQTEYQLPSNITITELTGKLINLSNQMLIKYLPLYATGKLSPYPQPATASSYTKKLTKKDGIIDWHMPAEQIEREIRAYLGWPGSQATLADRSVVITKAQVVKKTGPAGKVFNEGHDFGVFASKDALLIEGIKPAGKKEMSGAEFNRGYLHLRA